MHNVVYHSGLNLLLCFFSLPPQEEDVDFLAKFSRLVNGMGQSLVLSWSKLAKAGNVKVAAETLQAVEAKVPLLLQLLVHEDDDISANIVAFCYDYLHVLKQVGGPARGTGLEEGRGGGSRSVVPLGKELCPQDRKSVV